MSAIVIARNAIYNVVSFGITLVVTFLLVPVMLLHLGPTGFGAWAIVRVFVSYASLADLGLSSTVTKYVAEFHAKGDDKGIVRVIHSAFILYALIAIALLALLWLLDDFVIHTFFSTSGSFANDIRFILFGSMLIFSGNLIFSIFSSSLAGFQRMDTTNGILSIYWLINGALMYIALVFGLGLRGLVYANAAASAIAILLNAFFFFRYFRHLPFFSSKTGLADLRQSLRYSKDIFVIAVSNSVHLHFDKLLLSSFLSLSTVSSYEVASRVIQQMRQVPILMLNPILPAASELQAHQRSESITELYYFSLKYIVAFCVPFFACVGVFAHPLLSIWLGEGNELMSRTLQILIIPNFINLMTGPAYFISLGIGKAKYGMYSSLVGLIANMVLSFILLRSYGYFGAIAGTLIALTLEGVFFLFLIHRTLDIQWGRFLHLFVQPLGAIALGLVVAIGVGYFVESLILKTLVTVCLAIIVYLLALFRPRYFDEKDQAFFKEFRGKVAEKFFTLGERT